jgi:hypothetical protein
MQNAEWIALFRQLPKDLHSQLILVGQNRNEISIESIFRLEPNFLIVRGRVAGTTECGLLFLVPYDQLSTIYVTRELTEEDVNRMFETIVPPSRPSSISHPGSNGAVRLKPSQQGASQRPSSASSSDSFPTPSAVPVAATARPSGDPSSVARNNLLERLRAARNAAMPPK